jgi:hypothetical protein
VAVDVQAQLVAVDVQAQLTAAAGRAGDGSRFAARLGFAGSAPFSEWALANDVAQGCSV